MYKKFMYSDDEQASYILQKKSVMHGYTLNSCMDLCCVGDCVDCSFFSILFACMYRGRGGVKVYKW